MRTLCPALANKTYFNYGGQGPLPTPSLQAITASWQRIQELGPFTGAVWPFIEQETARVRQALAALCGVGPHRLALTENVTSGCVLPLWGLPWSTGDQLLISDCEHPGVVAACQELARREGLEIRWLPVLELCKTHDQASLGAAVLAALEQALTPQTRLVALSHLLWNNGSVMPITAVAERLQHHPNQPWLLVDAAQSMGAIPVEEAAAAADIYAFTGHKWCCGPEGLGGVALSERLLEQAQPTLIGWRSLRHEASAASSFHSDARRFEVATSCLPLCSGLATSLELLAAEGTPAERLERIQAGSRRLWQGLQTIKGVSTLLLEPPPAGLVSFTLAGHPSAAVVERLGEQDLWIRRLDDPDCLRACTHITTTEAEIDKLLEALRALA
ncbi:MAG: aminotransferase class V-fold PLP-dependent enzyme [Vulcanococcus sp.]|jgi:L-cysteine/cystine lyase|uniref:aminotransferase class V-fold PLP-dependent enzyme n=1 Tax=Vulcanococcus sp. TaxID=2856995 RepID=UPI0025DB30E1|nr:aminotransferase class V-fold PLP-dependent enzyme [Vulcanococcus sp.]MBW0173834.1 aminotransferase class V-fold PLP-dependent enzyme [Vulcanococcus sp.]MBW0181975.1 aminotransferase class V-fold PLP-dependent enzyme [Vulcanococcus sp.]